MIFLFILIYTVLFFIEVFIKKTIVTPFILTTLPIVLIAIFNQVAMVDIGYFYLSDIFFEYLLIGYLACFFASIVSHFFCSVLFINLRPKKDIFILPEVDKKIIKLLFTLISGILFLYSLFLIFFLRVDWGEVKNYFSSGFAAHAIYFSILGAVFIYGSSKRMSKLDIFLYCVCFFPLFLYGTRGWMFIVILASILLRGYIFNIWPNKLWIFLSPVLGISFMILTYLYRNFTGGVEATFSEIISHVMGYFLAGIQGANALFNSNLPGEPYMNLVFNALNNIKSFLLGGQYVSNSTPYFFIISNDGNLSNVTTLFGTLLYGLGIYFGSIYLFLLFFWINIIFFLRKYMYSIYFFIYLSVVCAAVSLAFFEYYLGLLFFIESIFILLFISIVVNLIKFGVLKYRFKF